jgi:hypothetical protein
LRARNSRSPSSLSLALYFEVFILWLK